MMSPLVEFDNIWIDPSEIVAITDEFDSATYKPACRIYLRHVADSIFCGMPKAKVVEKIFNQKGDANVQPA